MMKICIKRTILYLVVIAILLNATSMYRYLIGSPVYNMGFSWIIGVLCLTYVIFTKSIRLDNAIILRFLFLLLLLLVYAFITRYNIERLLLGFIGVFISFYVFAFSLFRNGEMKNFFQVFSNVILLVAILSLFFWLFGSVLDLLPGRKQLTYYWAEKYRTTYTYFYLYFENPTQNIVHATVCNLGIFTESPSYSGFLTYAMIIEMSFNKEITSRRKKRISNIKIVIYIITLISTNSTKGIIAFLVALAIDYISRECKSKWHLFLRIVAGILVISIVAYACYTLIGNKLETRSGITRLDDLRASVKTFLQHPLFGAGYGNIQAIIKNQKVIRGNQGLSMGFAVLLAYGGLWLLAIYAGAAIITRDNPYFKKNKKTWLLIVLVLFFNLFVSNSGFSDPYLFAIAAAYAMPR